MSEHDKLLLAMLIVLATAILITVFIVVSVPPT